MKKIAILGSTGSIGTQTLDVVRANGDIEVLGISAGKNIQKLEEQVREFSPRLVAVWDENAAQELAQKIQDTDTKVVAGMDGLLELAAMPDTEILVTAIVGMLGIRPTIEAIRAGKDIALANKETLVTAGHLIIPMAKEYGVKILPVDSEHSAVFQSLNGEHKEEVHKLLITASGGPFRGKTRKDLESVTLEDTLKHPNWVMGQKITVDSATLVNKGLEVMEARWLFDVSLDQIQVVVQPQSVIHSMVEFVCPTCTCFTMQDIFYKDNPKAGERRRVWASCQVDGYSDIAGGHSFRQSQGERMRFKVLHKVADYKKRFGYHMCVGCGRCENVCPEYISYVACLQKLKEKEGK